VPGVRRRGRGAASHLADVDALADDPRLAGYPYLSAKRAHLLRQLGRSRGAELAYRHAMTLTSNPVERRYLQDRAQSCADE
jgi:RNA polymerase sigma-70 factor, ECF subfamily